MFIFLYKSINQYYRDVIKTLDKKARALSSLIPFVFHCYRIGNKTKDIIQISKNDLANLKIIFRRSGVQ